MNEEKKITLAQAAKMVNGQLDGDANMPVLGLSSLEAAGEYDLTFLASVKDKEKLASTKAAAALVPLALDSKLKIPVIRVKDPYLAAAIIQNYLLAKPFQAQGIHPRSIQGEGCVFGKEITVCAGSVLGDSVTLGERVYIGPNTVIGDDVVIGDDCIIKANVTIESGSRIGNRVILHPGVVIGSDGYGYATDERGFHVKRPQVGFVRIDDDVEIGANTCVDCGTFGPTWIKSGVKIDNLVQLGHNAIIGENSLIVSHVAVAGSTSLGRNVVIGGGVMLNGHIHLSDRVMVAGASAVHSSQPAGALIGGIPAIPIKQWAKATTVYGRLPEINSEVRKLRKELQELQEKLASLQQSGEQSHG